MGPTYQGAMALIGQSLKASRTEYDEMAALIYERITDCWSDERAAEIDRRIDEKARLLQQRAQTMSELLPVLFKAPSGPG
jgi:hypothetical protein